MWLNGLVVSALGIRARGPDFDSPVAPPLHWVATLGKSFTHIASPVSRPYETGVQKGSFRRLSGYDKQEAQLPLREQGYSFVLSSHRIIQLLIGIWLF